MGYGSERTCHELGDRQRKMNYMTVIVEGFFKQGAIQLSEAPRGLQEGPVRMILIAEEQPKPPPFLTFGKYRTGRVSTLEDFKDAEWRGDEGFDHRHGQ